MWPAEMEKLYNIIIKSSVHWETNYKNAPNIHISIKFVFVLFLRMLREHPFKQF